MRKISLTFDTNHIKQNFAKTILFAAIFHLPTDHLSETLTFVVTTKYFFSATRSELIISFIV